MSPLQRKLQKLKDSGKISRYAMALINDLYLTGCQAMGSIACCREEGRHVSYGS